MPGPLTAPSSPMAYSPAPSSSAKSLFAGTRKNVTASSSLEDIMRADATARQRKISRSGQTPSSTPALSFGTLFLPFFLRAFWIGLNHPFL
jgi:hypothetical protein